MPSWKNEEEFWKLVVRHGLPWFRRFRRSTSIEQVDAALTDWPAWLELRSKIQPGDQIWPFLFPRSKKYWGKKRGYVVLRSRSFVGGLVTISE